MSKEAQKIKKFIREGLHFKCQGSGRCCVSRGEYGFVYLTAQDRKNLAEQLGTSTQSFTKSYCKKIESHWALKENRDSEGNLLPECIFLKDNRCSVYKGRPTQCKTWPFWPENMNAKTWKKEVAGFCPGVGKGKLHSAESIWQTLIEQSESEQEIFVD